MKSKFTLLLLSSCIATAIPLHAQTQRPLDASRMQRDVEIMEMVLDRLLNREASRAFRFSEAAARGTYVPNWGVLFQIPSASPIIDLYEMQERADRELLEKENVSARGTNAASPANQEQLLSEELWEFFSRYADVIGQLADNDRIAVYSEGGSSFSFFFQMAGEQARSFTSTPDNFFAWTSKGDIAALRAGKLSEKDFRNRMHVLKPSADEADIEIMSGILDKLTASRSGSAHGLYLPDYGAIFFASTSFYSGASPAWGMRERNANTPNARDAYQLIEEELRAARTIDAARERTWQENYKRFRSKLAEAFADYGHTLRGLKPDDWITVTTEFYFAPPNQPSGLVCQIRKQQLDAYTAGKISRDQLLKSVTYYEN